MSLIGSLNAAVGGMNAQSAALSSISDNVANSQTVGFKQTDTAFVDYLTQSSATVHSPGAVVARPEYSNSVQGAVTQVSNPTAVAVSGAGFLPVQLPVGAANFNPTQYYTRVGDFAPDNNGHMINSTGYALDGWPAITPSANPTFDTNTLVPIKISQVPSDPIATSTITLAANLPSVPPAGTTSYSSSVQANDATGTAQPITMTWTQVTAAGPVNAGNVVSSTNPVLPNQWSLTLTAAGATGPTGTGSPMLVAFGDGVTHPAGTIASISAMPATLSATPPTPAGAGTPATVSFSPNFSYGPQAITLNLGTFGGSNGVTQFSGTDFAIALQTQNGQTRGNYSSVSIQPSGDVVINYDNGAFKTIARVPLANFNSPDSLQQQDGQAFTATLASGNASIVTVGTGGAGKLIVGATEGSNVDLAAQFTQMIVAQRAYTANSKVITTANSMMQDALNMIQG